MFEGLNIVTKTDLEIKKFNFAKKLKLQTCLNFFVLSDTSNKDFFLCNCTMHQKNFFFHINLKKNLNFFNVPKFIFPRFLGILNKIHDLRKILSALLLTPTQYIFLETLLIPSLKILFKVHIN